MKLSDIEIGTIVNFLNEGGYVLDFSTADFDAFTYKNISTSDLLSLLRASAEGESHFPDSLSSHGFGANQFNERELQVLRLVCAGYHRKEHAKTMSLSENTIKTYLSQIQTKSGYTSVARLALWAVSNGYVAFQENRSNPYCNQ